MIIEKDFTFDAAHFLPNTPPGHKCSRMHGHTYIITIGINDELTDYEEWVMDFNDIKKTTKPIIELLDHTLLNAIPGLENPTAEMIAKFIFNKIKISLQSVSYVKVQETPTSRSIYYG